MTITEFLKLFKKRLWSQCSILLLVRPGGKPIPTDMQKPCTGELRWATDEMLDDCLSFQTPEQVAQLKAILKSGSRVHLGYIDGNCVYRHMLRFQGPVDFDGCIVYQLGPNEMITERSFCAPSARGHHFQQKSLFEMFKAYPERTSYTEIRAENPASLLGALRCGYEIRSLLTVKNRFFHRTLIQTPLSPEEAVRYHPDNL